MHRAGLERDLDGPRARHLSLARTTRVRDLLAAEGRIDASRIAVAGGAVEALPERAAPIRRVGSRSACAEATRRSRRVGPAPRPRPTGGVERGSTLDFGPERLA